MRREWPGNCRELRNLVERMTIMYPGEEISVEHIQPGGPVLVADLLNFENQHELELEPAAEQPVEVASFTIPPQATAPSPFAFNQPLETGETPPSLYDPIDFGEDPMDADQLAQLLVSYMDFSAGCDMKAHLIAVETQMISKALEATDGNVSKGAKVLNVRRTTLIEKIKKLGIES